MDSNDSNASRETRTGILYTLAAFTLWGFLPLYWRLLDAVPAFEILLHRIFWSCIFASVVVRMIRGRRVRDILIRAGGRRRLLLGGMLLGLNWFTYIYAISSRQVLQASMGYYINPLFSIFLGMVVLKERLNTWQTLAVGLAAIGVGYNTFQYGRFPWIAITLAGSFGLYGLLKKTSRLESLPSLAVETMVLAPAAAVVIGLKAMQGTGGFLSAGPYTTILMAGAGVVTALPLYWFAEGARRITLSRLGFMQYIAPSLTLLIAVVVFGEPFTGTHAITFGCIWLALLLYSLSESRPFLRTEQRILTMTRRFRETPPLG